MFLLEKKRNKAILTIYGYVGGYDLGYRTVIDAISEITKENYTQLDFHLHTYGGYVFDGNLIYNAFATFKGNLDIYIDGVAASMGSVIMMSGNKIHIAENGFIMLHAPQGGVDGTAEDMEKYAKLLRSMKKNFITKLMARTGKSQNEVEKWMVGDNWFDADEAISEGLADDKFDAKAKDVTDLDKEEVELLGAKATYLKFAALTKTTIPKLKTKKMDKKSLIARYGLTTVTEASTEEEVMAAIDAKITSGETKAKAAQDELKKNQKASILAAVDSAVAAGKIKKEKRDEYIARGEKIGLEELNAIFSDMQVYQSVSDALGKKDKKDEIPTDRKDWDWDKWQKEASAELEAMPKKDPEAFTALYKAKYGCNPEL
ncbi:MAG: ATP-dependent Clp protease proteolytic subunit [Bacteroidetes bacterium]|nr:ATP-dependent Clp protease proteolytic subunit [Bacteroidota bacterium]